MPYFQINGLVLVSQWPSHLRYKMAMWILTLSGQFVFETSRKNFFGDNHGLRITSTTASVFVKDILTAYLNNKSFILSYLK